MMVRIRKLKERSDEIAACLTCVLCNYFFVDATKIIDCFHTFCRKCIFAKFREEDLECCPVCNIYLGVNPYDRLRSDFLLQDIRNNAFPIGRENEALEHLPLALSLAEAPRKKAKVELGAASGSKVFKSKQKLMEEEDSDSDLESTRLPPGYPRQEAVFGGESIRPMALFYDNVNKPSIKKIWFTLIAAENQEGNPPLPQISSRYVVMRDGSVPVFYICRFLMEKLELESEDEVEIKCLGQIVSHEMRADVLSTLWQQEIALFAGWKPRNVGPPEDECLKILHYGRKVQSP